MKKSLALIPLFVFSLASCNMNTSYEAVPIYAFNTTISMTIYNARNASEYYNEIKNEMYHLSDKFDDFNKSVYGYENIYDLNLNRSIKYDKDIAGILEDAIDLYHMTDGYFNPFMGTLNHKWKEYIKDDKNEILLLSKEEIENELNIINNTSVSITDTEIKLIGDGNIDLGAIVKGYALEWIKDYFTKNDVSAYYCNLGNSSIYIGSKELTVGLEKPFESAYYKTFSTSNIGIGSSSYKYQYKEENGVIYHHLINPFTGYPSNLYESVNIIGSNNIYNDALSTALFSMELDKAKELEDKFSVDIILYKDNKIIYDGGSK